MPSSRPKPAADWFVPERDVPTQQRLIRPLLMLEFTRLESAELERLTAQPLEPGLMCVTLRSAWQARLAGETLGWRAARRTRFGRDAAEPPREDVMVRALKIAHPQFMGAASEEAIAPAADVMADLTRIARVAQPHLLAAPGAVGVALAMQAVADVPAWAHAKIDSDVAVALALIGVVVAEAAITLKASDAHRTAADYAERMLLGYGRGQNAPVEEDVGTPMEYRAHHVAVAFLGAALAWREWTACGWSLEQLVPWFRGIACRERLGPFVEMLE